MSIIKQVTVDLKLLFNMSKMKNNNNNHFMLEKYLKSLAWWVALTSMDMIIMINTSGIRNSGLKQKNYRARCFYNPWKLLKQFPTSLGRGVLNICNTSSVSTQFYTVDNTAVSLHRQESDHIDPSSHPLLGLVQMMISFFCWA